ESVTADLRFDAQLARRDPRAAPCRHVQQSPHPLRACHPLPAAAAPLLSANVQARRRRPRLDSTPAESEDLAARNTSRRYSPSGISRSEAAARATPRSCLAIRKGYVGILCRVFFPTSLVLV